MLLTQVLHKCQFRYNQSQLDELDDETLDEDVSGLMIPECKSLKY